MKKILVSECLYGERVVRYDGRCAACINPVFLKWKDEGRLVPVCPEICGGLPVPRSESQRRDGRVVTKEGSDVTHEFEKGAKAALRIARDQDVVFAILKEGSPSCGTNRVHDGTFTGKKIEGEGVTAELLRKSGFEVFSDEDIPAAARRLEEIIQNVPCATPVTYDFRSL